MKLLVISYLIVLASGQDCDSNGILIYEDLGCTPEYGSDKKCPIKYKCNGLESSKENCYYRGKAYADSEQVDSSLNNPSCNIGCFCRTGELGSKFTCAVLDCPEWLGSPIPPGCYRNYTLGQCCSVGYVCPPFDKIEKCVFEGKEYREGEKFYPSDTCLSCVCLKGFTGKLEAPFCRRELCGQQLQSRQEEIQNSCAPFYSKELHGKSLCCPDSWLCSDGTEVIKGEAKSDEICKFKDKTLKVGQYFERNQFEDNYGRSFNKTRCECVIPPLLKCIDV